MIERLNRNEAPSLLDTDKANELIDTINALTNSRGAGGIQVKADQNGSLLISPERLGSNSILYSPFQVISVDEDFVTINAGLVNGLIVPNVKIANSANTGYISLEIRGDSDGVIDATIVRDSSPPDAIPFVENGVNTTFKYPIAIVEQESLTSQLVNYNLFFKVGIAFEQPKESVLLGEYPNNIYYTWRASPA